jgi:hypothetical protein
MTPLAPFQFQGLLAKTDPSCSHPQLYHKAGNNMIVNVCHRWLMIELSIRRAFEVIRHKFRNRVTSKSYLEAYKGKFQR